MGGAQDDEPVPKRMKLVSKELSVFPNGLHSTELKIDSSVDMMPRPTQFGGVEEMVGSKGVIRKDEFVRIITKALYSLGYKKSGAYLEEESGISLQTSTANSFLQQILDGDWDSSVATLNDIRLIDETVVKSASFLILEQKFLEQLDHNQVMDALNTLRTEIATLCFNDDRVRELSSCILGPLKSSSSGSSHYTTNKLNVGVKSRSELLEELQKLLPPTVLVPERRLEQLVEQALTLQRETCVFHNSLNHEMSLYSDHHCGRTQIPSQTWQILEAHTDEVWFLKFSHNGKYLASSSSDHSAIIWEVDENGKVWLKHRLSGHENPVSSVSWSPDDSQLLTCGVEEAVRRWDVQSGNCLRVYEKASIGLVSCGWSPDGKCVFSGLNNKGICFWDLDGKEAESLKGHRTLKISDLEITKDGRIVSMCMESVILLFDRERDSERLIEEDDTITTFSLSRDNRFLLVNLLDQEIHLWNIDGADVRLVAKYVGHKCRRFIIRSCLGGLEEAFVASGSEDSQVYIWHRGSGELIESLAGHSGAVNSVSWNPANPHMLASASDDRTIRIWGINDLHDKYTAGGHRNGIHCCNGGEPEEQKKHC